VSDLEDFTQLCGDPRVMHFIGDGKPRSRQHSKLRFDRLAEDWNQVGYGLLAIERLSDQAFLGFAGLGAPDSLPQLLPATEVGWRIKASEWGLGYGTEAAKAIIDWAFGELGRERVLAIIRQDNRQSMRIAEKLGMTARPAIDDPRYEKALAIFELEATTWRNRVEN
jgi:RimJ/RimL family protein N-acetyltransferase